MTRPAAKKSKDTQVTPVQSSNVDVQEKEKAATGENPLAAFRQMVSKRRKRGGVEPSSTEAQKEQKERKPRASSNRASRSEQRNVEQRRDSQASSSVQRPDDGTVLVREFHPDIVPGGGYIQRRVSRDRIPLGAEILSEKNEPRLRRSESQPSHSESNQVAGGFPTGGILDAGRRLMSEGRLKNQERNNEVTKPVQQETKETKASKPTQLAQPATTGPTQSALSNPVSPAGLGSSFLSGLPTRSATPVTNSAAKQALHAAFGGASSSKPPSLGGESQAGAMAKPAQTPSRKPGMILDGRIIDTDESKEQAHFTSFHALPSPHKLLNLYEVEIQTENKRKVHGHLLLWPEGKLPIAARVNDNDPRPQVLAEEGVRGLGVEERLKDLQRWSMREWWDAFREKEQQPLAAWSGTRVVRDTHQLALLHDPGYQVFRLYQARHHELTGSFPMLMVNEGKLSFAFVNLDGLEERERITTERMKQILGNTAPGTLPSLLFSAPPFHLDGEALDLQQPENFALLRDQLEYLFQYPTLELPDPLGGTGSIRIMLGLWEMSQDNALATQMRRDAVQERCLTLRASAGYLSDIVRRELWRHKEKPARLWSGYTPKQVADAIRDNLYVDFHNMQGFQPKNQGEYQYHPESGEFQIVLRRRRCNHTLLLQGKQKRKGMLGVLSLYGDQKRDGLDPLADYSTLLNDQQWDALCPGLQWQNGWMMAPGEESRSMWADRAQRPVAPVVRHMPPWHRGVALGMYLLDS